MTIRNIFRRVLIATMSILLICGVSLPTVTVNSYAATASTPARVVNVKTGTAVDCKYAITWSVAKNAKTYQVYRSATEKGTYSLLKTVTTAKYTASVPAGKTYYFKVRGVNGSKKGEFSTALKISTPAEITVAVVTGLKVGKAENNKYPITWTAVKNAKTYQVYRSATEKGTYSLLKTVTTTKYTASVPAGKTYYFKVRGVNGSKNGVFSAVLKISTPENTVATVTGLKKEYAGHYNYKITWTSAKNAVSYQIYSADSISGNYSLYQTVTAKEFTVYAPPGTTKYFKIRGINGSKSGEFSDILTVSSDAETAVATGVPSYWNEEIRTSEEAFNSTAGNSSFIFFTDAHWNANRKYSPALVNYFTKQLNIPLTVFGGDVIEGTYDSSSTATKEIKSFYNSFGSDIHLFATTGNHDYNTSAFDSDPITDKTLYGLIYKREQSFATVAQYGRCAYTDDETAKVRYISLYFDAHLNNSVPQYGKDVDNSYPTASELKWLKKTVQAQKLTEEWTVVIFTHGYWNYKNKGIDVSPTKTGIQLGNYLLELEADSDTKADIGCWLVGHTHRDLTTVISDGTESIRIICTNTDSYKDGGGTRKSGDMGGQIMTAGRDTEQVIDLVRLDTEKKMIHLIRVGAGEDRHYSY